VAAATATDQVLRLLSDADVALSYRFPEEWLIAAPRLRWLHLLSSGADHVMYPRMRERGVWLTNSRGAAAPAVAEHALLLMLALVRQLPAVVRQQGERRWARPWGGELHGRSALVVGLGPIGQRVAALASAFGMRVIGCRRAGLAVPGVERVVAPADLPRVVPDADFLILTASLTGSSRRLLDAGLLALARPGAYVVNVGRGELLDEPAVRASLRDGRLAGAALDVFPDEPLPVDSPWYDLPNVLLTPHLGGRTPSVVDRAVALFGDNLARWRRGEPLLNRVDPSAY
jgi:phosphoglycerate dehydrogenase-like enzyme